MFIIMVYPGSSTLVDTRFRDLSYALVNYWPGAARQGNPVCLGKQLHSVVLEDYANPIEISVEWLLCKILVLIIISSLYDPLDSNGGQKMTQVLRIIPERRTGKDRRRIFSLHRFFYQGDERRNALYNRRSQKERRDGWVRISKWSSVEIQGLKIAKYIL